MRTRSYGRDIVKVRFRRRVRLSRVNLLKRGFALNLERRPDYGDELKIVAAA